MSGVVEFLLAFCRRAEGGKIPARASTGVPVMLAPSEVWCGRCDWRMVGGTPVEQYVALSGHECRP